MIVKTRGIVFRAIKYSETSLIVDVYTEVLGLRTYLISGVRSPKARIKASLLQVMSLVDMVVYNREDRDLNRIREIRPAYVYHSVPFNLQKGAVGLFLAEVARKTIREPEAHPELFSFLFRRFQFLDETPQSIGNIHLHFLLELSSLLGFVPSGEQEGQTPYFDLKEGVFVASPPGHTHYLDEEQSLLLFRLLNCPVEQCHEITINRIQRKALLQHLLHYYALHVDHFPEIHSHQILEEVLLLAR